MCARSNRRVVAGVLAAMSLSATAGGQTAESTDLRDRIAALERDLAQLRHQEGGMWLTESRAADIRALVQDVLTDVDSRASLLDDGATAGWSEGGGFFLRGVDGSFSLSIKGQLQFRYVVSMQDDSAPDGDSSRAGFENSRTKLRFTGNVVDPNWLFMIEGRFDRGGGTFGLEDAYIARIFGDSGWLAIAGQFKVPMLREELVSSSFQQAVERTLVNEEFTAGRTQGVGVDYRGDAFHLTVGFTDGHPATGGFNMPALAYDTEYSFTARGELLLGGAWAQFDDLPSWRGEESALLLGGAAHYQVGEYGTIADELDVFQWTVDASAEFGGCNVLGALVGRHLSGAAEADQYGAIVQGGFFLSDHWELFGRYEWGDLDFDDAELSIVTIGATRYFAKHQLKWTTDVGFGLSEVSSMWGGGFVGGGADPTGWRTDAPDEDGQVVIRSQVQLLF